MTPTPPTFEPSDCILSDIVERFGRLLKEGNCDYTENLVFAIMKYGKSVANESRLLETLKTIQKFKSPPEGTSINYAFLFAIVDQEILNYEKNNQ